MSSKGGSIRKDDLSDEGELTDESGTDRQIRTHPGKSSMSSSPCSDRINSRGASKAKEEEDRLRRNLLAKHSSKPFAHSSDDDEQEMFTMQPGDSNTSRLAHRLEKADKVRAEKDKKDREHRDRHERHSKHKHDKKDRDRHSEKHEKDRSERAKHDERHSRERDRHDDHRHKLKAEKSCKSSPYSHERSEKLKLEKPKDSDRDKKEKEEKHRERSARKHGRSLTGSPSPENERKRNKKDVLEPIGEKRASEVNETDVDIIKITKSLPSRGLSEEQDDEQSEIELPTNAVDQLQADFDNSDEEEAKEITSFVLDCPAGPKKYSKFDSSPEPDDLPSPTRSEVGMPPSDEEEEEEEEECNLDFEDLSDVQKARLSPDTRQRLELDYQKRLIAGLPVYYPGVMGCRSVDEYECVNRVEEGTYGVVFRAKEKRTDQIVALKRLKMEKEREGFPITSLREINMLLKAGSHENIVNIKEIVIGSSLDKVYVAMEFVEHDLKSLMDTMSKKGKRFTIGEQKTLMRQLLAGLAHMHHLWILHRDLKSSNLLLSHKGILKIADFGLAREFGDPLKPYTSIVVTLWYRSPELLLGKKLYSTPVDMWSVGCLMAEFQLLKPLFPGKGEMDQIKLIYQQMGTPTKEIWPEYEELPLVKQVAFDKFPYMQLRKKFSLQAMSDTGFKLLTKLLTYDPEHRITAEEALNHAWFTEDPKPTPTDMFPTFPAKSEQHKAPPMTRKREIPVVDNNTAKLLAEFQLRPEQVKATGFSLKFDKAKF